MVREGGVSALVVSCIGSHEFMHLFCRRLTQLWSRSGVGDLTSESG